MKQRKLSVKHLIMIGGLLFILFGVIIFLSILYIRDRGSLFEKNYKMYIKVDAVRDDDTRESYVLEVVNEKKGTKIKTDFYERPIYIVDGKTIFDIGGKYSYYESELTIENLDKIINRIKLGSLVKTDSDDRNYNPNVSKEVINDILKVLFIKKDAVREEKSYIVLNKGKIKNFSLYLVGLDGYKDLNITMAFSNIEKKDSFDLPIFYEEIMNVVEEDRYAMIK